ncbi:MAG: PD-(D/E)XK nuclease family protein, partial [Thermoanaerobaculia bacterium]|nr:PD-(D/E)XK nuclease family protein [Thermoanaerobaculia bacterium]
VEPLLRAMESPSQVDAVRGRASYLLDVSDRLARSLRARGRRWRNTFSVADGLVASGEVMSPQLAAALADRRLDRRPYSPTALQSWAACPYRFHLQGLMRLRPRDEAVRLERLDPRTRGSLFHQVQAETLRELARLKSLPVDESNLGEALEVVDQRLDAVALASEEELVPALPGVWRSEIESLRVDLRGWLRDVADRGEGWTPRYFELAFGLPPRPDRDPSSVAEPIKILGRFAVRGAIDLVEVDPATERLRVTDHKTGRPPEAKEVGVGGGEILQPLIYALAAQEVLGGSSQSGRLYYSSRRGGYETREVPVSPYHEKYLEDVLTAVDEAVGAGFLPAAPRAKACDYCDFRPICGPYEELRTGRKRREPLAVLDKVRTYQ